MTDTLLDLLKHKSGSWVEWGQACQQLQKQGISPQQLFEDTGFQPILQNQLIVAAQVFAQVEASAPPAAVSFFRERGSDSLYELRVLAQEERAGVAELLWAKKADIEMAHEVVRAVKEYGYFKELPEGFTAHPGDAMAYACWRTARQKSDLQERSRLIARGLHFAESLTARQHIERLLTDFTVIKTRSAPRPPIYRYESVDELPWLLPVVGRWPLTEVDLQQVPLIVAQAPFRLVQAHGPAAWVPVPGWQVLRAAQDPVAFFAPNTALGLPQPVEEILVVIDRARREWQEERYFLWADGEHLVISWFEQAPTVPLLGSLLLYLRAPKIFDEDYTHEPWQIDE